MTTNQMDASVSRADALLSNAIGRYHAALNNPNGPMIGANPNSPVISGTDRTQAYTEAIVAEQRYKDMKANADAAERKSAALANEIRRRFENGQLDVYRYNAEMVTVVDLHVLAGEYRRAMQTYVSLVRMLCKVAADHYNLAADVLRGKERVVL